MNKILLIILAVGISLLGLGIIEARITGGGVQADAFCAGPDGAEACIDSSGNFIPTTDNNADLGTSALRWKVLHLVAGGMTAGSVTTATLAADSVIESKILDGAVTTDKIKASAVTTVKLYFDLPIGGLLCVTTSKIAGTCQGGVTINACECG